jgi:topoisomerase IA-like protein
MSLNSKPSPTQQQEQTPSRILSNDITVKKGQYGPYIRYKNKNIALPKKTNIETITLDECITIINTPKPKKIYKRIPKYK